MCPLGVVAILHAPLCHIKTIRQAARGKGIGRCVIVPKSGDDESLAVVGGVPINEDLQP